MTSFRPPGLQSFQAVIEALTTLCNTHTHIGMALQRLAAWTTSDAPADADEPLLRLAVPICLQQLRSALRRGRLAEVASDSAQHAGQVSPSLSELMRLWLPTCNHRLHAQRSCRPQCLLPATLLKCKGSQSMHGLQGFTSCLPQVLASLTQRLSRRATRRQLLPFFTELLASGRATGGQVNCFTEICKRFGAISLCIGGPLSQSYHIVDKEAVSVAGLAFQWLEGNNVQIIFNSIKPSIWDFNFRPRAGSSPGARSADGSCSKAGAGRAAGGAAARSAAAAVRAAAAGRPWLASGVAGKLHHTQTSISHCSATSQNGFVLHCCCMPPQKLGAHANAAGAGQHD